MSESTGSGAHEGSPAGTSHRADPWETAITATTDEQVLVRGVPLEEAIGSVQFPAMLLHLWRGDQPTSDEADLLGACLVAAIDHGALSPSALVTRTIASTRSGAISGVAGGMLAFSDYHGAAVSRAMTILATAPPDGDLGAWADQVFEAERASGRRLPGVGHRWHNRDLRSERLLELAAKLTGEDSSGAMTALAERVARHSGNPTPVNIDGALAVALTALRLDPAYGDVFFALARGFGLAAHYVEEESRGRPMRTVDPTAARYDGPAIPTTDHDDD
jgi:citrate synthase